MKRINLKQSLFVLVLRGCTEKIRSSGKMSAEKQAVKRTKKGTTDKAKKIPYRITIQLPYILSTAEGIRH